MGGGEAYWQSFADWFRSLAPQARGHFVAEHPEPPDWKYFYEYICLDQRDEDGHDRLYALIAANWRKYQSTEYNGGRCAEEAGDFATAIRHYGHVIQHGDFLDAQERYERLRQTS
jgi:hypothetical protein